MERIMNDRCECGALYDLYYIPPAEREEGDAEWSIYALEQITEDVGEGVSFFEGDRCPRCNRYFEDTLTLIPF